MAVFAVAADAQSVQHLSRPITGGMPGVPVMTGVNKTPTNVVVTWDGPSGYYQLFMRTNLAGVWQALGGRTNTVRRAAVNPAHNQAFFRVSGPAPRYAGAQACAECHRGVVTQAQATEHAAAFTSPAFAASGGQNNPSCLPCHTVGYGLPSGYVSTAGTPHLAGVQCENCHGPAALHAANSDDPISKPRVEIAGALCGGCHNDAHHPTYDEWVGSGHATVTEDMNPTSRISNCGRCHSGSVRLAMLKGDSLPSGDANHGVGCVTCHDPHKVTGNPAQLRNPVASTNDYFLASSDVFSTKYDPAVNVCGQCHNHRGTKWTDSERPPHHSPQYNMMLGTVGAAFEGDLPPRSRYSHADLLEDQCVSCHMQSKPFAGSVPAKTGHNFRVTSYDKCLECHAYPEILVEAVQEEYSWLIDYVKSGLDEWARNYAPEGLKKYGAKAWEYTRAGTLSGGSGPTAADQALVPDAIKKARFNLYLAYYDGSLGVHNPTHTAQLLDAAEELIRSEMNK